MATTSLSLGEHWEVFIKNEISSGRYGSASEVVRDALRAMEERKSKLEASVSVKLVVRYSKRLVSNSLALQSSLLAG